jgi:MazG family protein
VPGPSEASPDPLAAVPTGPVPASREGGRLLDLVRVMARLRGPGGCPWDHEQTHRSLARHLLEEAHEVLEAIDSDDPERLREELGDLLLQVVFHAQMAADAASFDIDDVAAGIVGKLIRRHPHVFGEVEVSGAEEVLVNWERIKAEEKGERPLEDDIPASLPALARAAKVQRRAAGWGFDWRTAGAALAKLREEVEELDRAVASAGRADAAEGREGRTTSEEIERELGDVLFAATAVARKVGVDPESALRRGIARFAERYEAMRARAVADGVDLSEMDDDALLAYFRATRDQRTG